MKKDYITEILISELDRSYTTLNGFYGNLMQILVATTALISGIFAALSLGNKLLDKTIIIISFIAPLPLIALMGGATIVIGQIYLMIYYIRSTSIKLQELYKLDSPISYYEKRTFPSMYQSSQRGNTIFNYNRTVVVAIPLLLILAIVVYIFYTLYEYSHYLGTSFISIYGILLLGIFLGLNNVIFEMHRDYEYYSDHEMLKRKKVNLAFILPKPKTLRILLPRPTDFVTKAPWFIAGVIVALFEGYSFFDSSLINILFEPLILTKLISIFVYSFLWLIIQEGIIQQAKYIWNDIRDFNKDKFNLVNISRPITKNENLPKSIYFELIARWVMGLLFSYLISIKLFYICITFLFLQVLYELWAKPYSKEVPLLPMIIVALGAALRFLGGALAMNWDIKDIHLQLYLIIIFFIGVIYSIVFWILEEDFLRKNSKSVQRGQSVYFLKYGNFWILGSVLIIMGTSSLLFFKFSKNFPHYYTKAVEQYMTIGYYISSTAILNICIILLLSIVITVLAYSVSLIKKNSVILVNRKIKLAIPYLSIVAILYFLALIFSRAGDRTILVFSLILMVFTLQLYIIDYKAFTLTYLRENLPIVIGLFFSYLFNGNSGIKITHLFFALLFINSPKFQLIKDAVKKPTS